MGQAWQAWRDETGPVLGESRYGRAGMGGQERARSEPAKRARARQAGTGMSHWGEERPCHLRHGKVRPGWAAMAWIEPASCDKSGPGVARQARQGLYETGLVRLGRAGLE